MWRDAFSLTAAILADGCTTYCTTSHSSPSVSSISSTLSTHSDHGSYYHAVARERDEARSGTNLLITHLHSSNAVSKLEQDRLLLPP